MSSEENRPSCPECDRPLSCGAMVLFEREDDGKRTCRGVWECDQRHVWWGWLDRPGEPLEACPYPDILRE
ncbi:dehydrogenase [Kitasatospora sp. NPDC004614]|uniref:dehydrogenase n=1 Tax=unclassified Kitasatospora TaxID=2633591 RepID=UPI0036AA8E45